MISLSHKIGTSSQSSGVFGGNNTFISWACCLNARSNIIPGQNVKAVVPSPNQSGSKNTFFTANKSTMKAKTYLCNVIYYITIFCIILRWNPIQIQRKCKPHHISMVCKSATVKLMKNKYWLYKWKSKNLSQPQCFSHKYFISLQDPHYSFYLLSFTCSILFTHQSAVSKLALKFIPQKAFHAQETNYGYPFYCCTLLANLLFYTKSQSQSWTGIKTHIPALL